MDENESPGGPASLLLAALGSQRSAMGFWNAPAEPGTWRATAVWRHGPNPGPRDETATCWEMDAASAQAVVRRMLGLGGEGPLPKLFSPARCARSLLLSPAWAAAESFGSGLFEGQHSPPMDPLDSACCRAMAFELEGLEGVAAFFELAASLLGGRARHSRPELAVAAREIASRVAPEEAAELAERLLGSSRGELRGVDRSEVFACPDPREPGARAAFEPRSLGLALGLPMAAVFRADARLLELGRGSEASFASTRGASATVAELGARAFELGAHVPLGKDVDLRAAVPGLAALQEAWILRRELAEARSAPAERPSQGQSAARIRL